MVAVKVLVAVMAVPTVPFTVWPPGVRVMAGALAEVVMLKVTVAAADPDTEPVADSDTEVVPTAEVLPENRPVDGSNERPAGVVPEVEA